MSEQRKAIFITGGGSGIGRAIAHYFGERGWFVGLGDVDEHGMAVTQDNLSKGYSFAQKFDVRDRAAWDEALKGFALATGGRIDVLVNNAGIAHGGPLVFNTVDEIERVLDVNLKGVIFGAQAAYPYLKQTAPNSCLLNTSSASALYGSPSLSVYGATKFGVKGLTETLDAEWSGDGIKVRSLIPSFIGTPLIQNRVSAVSNRSIEEVVTNAGLEITPVEEVAKAAWDAVHGEQVHTLVGKTAKKLAFYSRWFPGLVRKNLRTRSSDPAEQTTD